MINLNERKKKILQVLIHQYIRTAQPVGSRTLAENYGLDLSSATIRNYLADLEEEGYLTHPYTSAGRIPTDKGYRFYVDSLIEIQHLVLREEERIRREYSQQIKRLEDLLRYTSHVLACSSHYAGFVLSPEWEKNILQSLQLISVGERKILVVLVTEAGSIRHLLIENELNLGAEKLYRLSRILSKKVSKLTLREVKEKIYEKIKEEERTQTELLSLARKIAQQTFASNEKEEIYLEGANNILALPEFSDSEKIKNLLKFIEERKLLSTLLEKKVKKTGIKVTIGSENPLPEMQECSLVTSVYHCGEQLFGLLGILGPKRMEYSRMIALVDFISQLVNDSLEKLSSPK